MADNVQSVAGQRVLFYAEAGPPVGGDDGALAVIGAAAAAGAGTVVVPVSRLAPGFLRLSTGLAGEFLQKLVNYRVRLIVAGDISSEMSESAPLRDFVRECNRGGQIAFVVGPAELEARLSAWPGSR